MPFTFAHPAAVIPIKKKWPAWFDSTALILGSMSPDFEYFIRFKAQAFVGHTLGGFLYFNLPLVCLTAVLWHYIIKKPFILSLPTYLQRFFPPALNNKHQINLIKILVFIFSALTGMATHVLWDAFTHIDGYFVSKIVLLSSNINLFGINLPIYKILQHGSTLAGFAIIIVYLHLNTFYIDKTPPKMQRVKKVSYWITVLLIIMGVFSFRLFVTLEDINLSYYGIYIVSFISSTIIGVAATSAAFQVFKILTDH